MITIFPYFYENSVKKFVYLQAKFYNKLHNATWNLNSTYEKPAKA